MTTCASNVDIATLHWILIPRPRMRILFGLPLPMSRPRYLQGPYLQASPILQCLRKVSDYIEQIHFRTSNLSNTSIRLNTNYVH